MRTSFVKLETGGKVIQKDAYNNNKTHNNNSVSVTQTICVKKKTLSSTPFPLFLVRIEQIRKILVKNGHFLIF